MQKSAYKVKEWCREFGIGRTTLFNLWRTNRGPKRVALGRLLVITHDDTVRWLAKVAAEGDKPVRK